MDRESCCAVALLGKHALICRISQIADLACSSQPYGRLRNRSTQSPAGWRPVVVLAAAFFLGDLCLICCGCSRVSLIQLHRIEPVPSVLCKDRHAKCILCFADWSRVNVLHMGAVFLAVVTTKSTSELPIGLKNQISRDHFPQNRRSIIIEELGFPTVNGNDIIWARSGIGSIRGNYQIGYRKKPQYHNKYQKQRHQTLWDRNFLHCFGFLLLEIAALQLPQSIFGSFERKCCISMEPIIFITTSSLDHLQLLYAVTLKLIFKTGSLSVPELRNRL